MVFTKYIIADGTDLDDLTGPLVLVGILAFLIARLFLGIFDDVVVATV